MPTIPDIGLDAAVNITRIMPKPSHRIHRSAHIRTISSGRSIIARENNKSILSETVSLKRLDYPPHDMVHLMHEVAVSTRTALALELASQLNITLATQSKGEGLYIFCGERRLIGSGEG